MPAAAIPAITAGGAIGSGILSYMSARRASQLSPAEKGAQQTQRGASNALSQQGQALSGYGMPKLQQAGNYYSTLAGGNRAAMSQSLAPEVANLNDVYGGTARTLERFLRGPERDVQRGEVERNRAGAIGSLFTGARERGVAGLASLGQYGVSQGAASFGGAAGIAGSVAGQGSANRFGGVELQRQAGADTAGLIFQLLRSGAFASGRSRGTGFGPAGAAPAGGAGWG